MIKGINESPLRSLRYCTVEGKKALFHQWNTRQYVVEPSPMIGGAPGGQIQYTYGLVEYENGQVDEVPPHHVIFLDTKQIMTTEVHINVFDGSEGGTHESDL